jgi:hypothetical protein
MNVARHPAAAGLLGTGHHRSRPGERGVIGYPRLISRDDRNTPIGLNHTVPHGTNLRSGHAPGNIAGRPSFCPSRKKALSGPGNPGAGPLLRVHQPLGPALAAHGPTSMAGVRRASAEIRSFYRIPR